MWRDDLCRRYGTAAIPLCDLAHKGLQAQARWIPVSERLPERGGVLAVTADGQIDIYHWNLLADYANDPDPSARLTHWMPLPAAPDLEQALKMNEEGIS
jgi:hypothetical protein